MALIYHAIRTAANQKKARRQGGRRALDDQRLIVEGD
jgi:hypothetical protein